MKQQYGEMMRKWSHTFSTCSKTSQLHSPLADHGSCCHSVPSFLRPKKSSKQRRRAALFGLLLLLRAIQSTVKDTSSFPSSGFEETRPALSRTVHMAKGGRCVYTHLMLFHTRVHPSSHISLIVCPPLPLFTRRKLTS